MYNIHIRISVCLYNNNIIRSVRLSVCVLNGSREIHAREIYFRDVSISGSVSFFFSSILTRDRVVWVCACVCLYACVLTENSFTTCIYGRASFSGQKRKSCLLFLNYYNDNCVHNDRGIGYRRVAAGISDKLLGREKQTTRKRSTTRRR